MESPKKTSMKNILECPNILLVSNLLVLNSL